MVVLLKNVAHKAGVSSATVSQVLNDRPTNIRVSQATRQRILQIARELNYRPNIVARGLRMQKTHTVGIISYDTHDPMAIAFASRIDRELYARGYRTVVGDAQHTALRAARHAEDFLATRVDGIVFLASSYQPEPEILENIRAQKVPVVCLGRDLSKAKIPSMVIDNEAGTKAITRHLLSRGYRRLGVIVGSRDYDSDSESRWLGVWAACKEQGVEWSENMLVYEENVGWDPAMGYWSMQEMLAWEDRPQAVVAFDDCTAFGAIRAATEAGLRVPDDLAVVGFDDVPMSAFYNPPLTTIRTPVEAMVGAALETLGPWMNGQVPDQRPCRFFAGDLVVRRSCGNKE